MAARIYAKNPGQVDDWIVEGAVAPSDLELLLQNKKANCLTFQKITAFPPRPFQGLSALKSLKFVTLNNCPLAPGDFADLAALPKLEALLCTECPVKDDDLGALRGHPKLGRLWLNGSRITDAGLDDVAAIVGLVHLGLDDTAITDAGLAKLGAALKLNHLTLRNTAVTNEGILQLAALPKLKLSAPLVSGTAVTEGGLDALFQEQSERARAAKGAGKSKPAAMLAPEEIDAAKATLYAFFREMHECEKRFAEAIGAIPDQPRKQVPLETSLALFEQCREAYQQIFEKHCTLKKRAMGKAANASIGWPPEYEADPQKEPVTSVETPSATRVVIETQQHFKVQDRCQYVLLKRDGRWLIDSKKLWRNGWEQTLL